MTRTTDNVPKRRNFERARDRALFAEQVVLESKFPS